MIATMMINQYVIIALRRLRIKMIVYTDKGKFEYCRYDDNTVLEGEGLCFDCLVMEGKI